MDKTKESDNYLNGQLDEFARELLNEDPWLEASN